MKPTVHDIARTAGVSLATVDRVLNERPGVRAKTRDLVHQAMSDLGYVRDVAAANLARGRLYRFDFILPDNDNAFMHSLKAELETAMARGSLERMQINVVMVPAFDELALAAALDDVVTRKPDGVAFVAIDAETVRAACARVTEEGIYAVTLVSDLTGSSRQHYVGIDNIAAGRTAARLLGLFANGISGSIAVLAGSLRVSDHHQRLDGFLAAMQEDFPVRVVLPVLEGLDEAGLVEKLMDDLFATQNDIACIYSLGAGNSGLVKALSKLAKDRRPLVVAHERDVVTSRALGDNLVHALLAQDAGHEIRSAVRVLKASVDNQPIIAGQEFIRIEIYLKDNLPWSSGSGLGAE